ncbi:MAG TPA: transporter [Pirellulaceae bacterium]|jgi:hypothetical protein|nr:transporter [Pirellulaceae bacterium]
MRWNRLIVPSSLLIALVCANGSLRAQWRDYEETPGTLFQWSGGMGEVGGPALDEPLVTDRPDFTEAPTTVGRGVAQLEFGYTYAWDDEGGKSESHSFPETLLRVGILADWLEARIAWNQAHATEGGTTFSGSEDLYVGAKIGLTPQDGFFPEMGLIPQMTLPTGSDAFTAGEVLPGVNWVYGWDLSETISTGGSSQINRAIDDVGEEYAEFAQSWTIGYSLTDRLGAFTEWFALFPSGATEAKPEHYFDGGFTYLITDDIQWDVRAGMGVNEAAEDFFAGTGLSIRFR